MTFVHGSKGAVYLSGTDLTPVLTSGSLDVSVNNHDTSVIGSTWKSNAPGTVEATLSFEGFYSSGFQTFEGLINGTFGVAEPLTYCPGGNTAGSLARLALINATATGYAGSADDMVTASTAMSISGAIEFGVLLHPMGTDTNTTTGASLDGLASTSTGYTAHLHVGSVTGGSWAIKLQDSADNGNWGDIAAAGFAAVTTYARERIQSLTATTVVRRYVRYVATRTGGVAGDSIYFALSFARSKTT